MNNSKYNAHTVDLDNAESIALFINSFYDKVLSDPVLEPIFSEVAGVDLQKHIPIICSYWEKLLLGDKAYQRHTMNIHRAVDLKYPFKAKEFEHWLSHFLATANNEQFAGDKTDRAMQIASSIAHNMKSSLDKERAVREQGALLDTA